MTKPLTADHLWSMLSGEVQTYRRRGAVTAKRLATPYEWTTANGQQVVGNAGDWLVTDGADEWTIRNRLFHVSYRPTGIPDQYQKTTDIRAAESQRLLLIATPEGTAIAENGDFVAFGGNGEVWPIARERFLATYSLVADLEDG